MENIVINKSLEVRVVLINTEARLRDKMLNPDFEKTSLDVLIDIADWSLGTISHFLEQRI